MLEPLRAFAEGPGAATHVLLMPSARDAHADPVFPQPPLPGPARPLPGRVRMLPNPATFRLNELVVGASAPDYLKEVGASLSR